MASKWPHNFQRAIILQKMKSDAMKAVNYIESLAQAKGMADHKASEVTETQ
jgi:hypothetical protein